MNISNSTSPIVSANLTQVETWIQIIIFYGLLGGIISVIGHTLMAVGIIRTKKLRTRFFAIVCSLMITRVVLSAEFFMLAVYRALRNLNLAPGNLSRSGCFLIHLQLYYAAFLEMLLLLIMVLDRIAAIAAPSYYRLLTVRHAMISCTAAFVISLMKLIPYFATIRFEETVPCANVNSPINSMLEALSRNVDLSVGSLIFVLYMVMLLYLRCYLLPKLKKASTDEAGKSAMIAFKRQMKLMPILRRLVLIHSGFTMTSKLLMSLATVAPKEYDIRLTAYGGMMTTVDVFVNLVVLLMTNKELRQASFECMKKATVGSVSMTQVTTQQVKTVRTILVNSMKVIN